MNSQEKDKFLFFILAPTLSHKLPKYVCLYECFTYIHSSSFFYYIKAYLCEIILFYIFCPDVQNRWGDMTKQLNHLGAYVTAAEGLRISWNTIEPYIADKMTNLPTKSLDIIHKSETTVNISKNTLIVIDEKLNQMLRLKQNRLSKTSNDDQGPAFIADLISNGNFLLSNTFFY